MLYVFETPPFVYIQSQKIINSVIGSLEEEAKKVYDLVNKAAQKYDVAYQAVTLKGHPVASVIIEYFEEKDFDHNIIGRRGHGKFKTAILGSVSHHVFNHTKKPVTLVKKQSDLFHFTFKNEEKSSSRLRKSSERNKFKKINKLSKK